MTAGEGARIEDLDVAVYTIPTDQPEADGTMRWCDDHDGHRPCAGRRGGRLRVDLRGRSRRGRRLATYWRTSSAAGTPSTSRPPGRPCRRSCGTSGVLGSPRAPSPRSTSRCGTSPRGCSTCRSCGCSGGSDDVPVYGSGGFTSYDDDTLRQQLRGWVEDDGIPRVKIKIGESWGTREDRDLARARLARETIGDDVELFVDANGGYSVGQAVRMGRRFDDLGVTWFEEPVSSDDLDGLRHVRSRITADVAAGEYAWSLADAHRLVTSGAVDCLQADATRCGGYTEWLRIAAVAAAHNLQISAHCAPALHAPVAAAVTNLRHVEWFHDHVRIEHMVLDGAPEAKGGAMVPDLAVRGHGVTLAPSAERYRTC